MWYLIVPPIIVVVSLAFLLWYLSRKGADPAVAARVSHLEQSEHPVAFSRTKSFFLRMLEKTMQHSKVISLRMHNILNDHLQSVKQRRQQIIEATVIKQDNEKSRSEVTYASERVSESVVPEWSVPAQKDDILAAPIIRQKKSDDSKEIVQKEQRPMISDTATHPEIRKKRVVRNDSREEALIGSIAANPKDFSAYEALGDYYLERENAKDAKECYRQVLRLSPTHRMVKIKIRRLEKLLVDQKIVQS